MITGTGFPPFRGGLLKYADAVSAKYIADQLEVYAQKGRARLKPAAALNQLAKTNRKFYQS
jgi:3-hydroxyacyl-CoA dehydrogenase/enoyl-CoA hydratase/3-hydroxybutyryl-CoA epimerase